MNDITKAVPQEVDLVKTRLRCVDPSNTEIENSAERRSGDKCRQPVVRNDVLSVLLFISSF